MDAAIVTTTGHSSDVLVYSTGELVTDKPEFGNNTDQPGETIRHVTLSLFMTIFVFGVFGNILTIYVICRLLSLPTTIGE